MAPRTIPAWIKKTKIPVLIVLGVVLLYAVSGFWLGPYLIKNQFPKLLAEKAGREGSIQEISINPFLFTVDLKGLSIQRKKGGPFVAFDQFFVDFELSSLVRRALVFDEVRLSGLLVEVERLKHGGFNFDDLLAASEKQEAEPEEENSAPFPVWINRLEIHESKLVYDDRSRTSPFHSEIAPIDLAIFDFQTYLDKGSKYQFKATLASGGTFDWQGKINLAPLHSAGRIKLSGFQPILIWRYLQDTVNFELRDGVFSLDARYKLHQPAAGIQVEVSDGRYVLENLKIAEKGDSEPVIEIPRLILDGIAFNLLDQKLSIASLASEKARIHGWVRPDNKKMNFEELFRPATSAQQSTASPPSSKTAPDDSKWLITLDNLELNGYRFLFEDRSLASTARLDFNPLAVTLKHFSSDLAGKLPFTIRATVNRSGHLNVDGNLGFNPFSTAAKIDLQLGLPDFQPYIDPVTKLEFEHGEAKVGGDVDFKLDEHSNPLLHFQGLASIEDFIGKDKLQNEKLLDWKTLSFDGVEFNLKPMNVAVKEVTADGAYTRFLINADGTSNFSKVFGGEPQANNEKQAKAASAGAKSSPEPPIRIDTVTIRNASADFADLSLKPKFATRMEKLNGAIRGLSTERNSRATVDLTGRADRTAPLRIKGQIQVFDPDNFTDISLDFKNLSLSNLTPYSGKFAGYRIKKGKMAVNLKYRIDHHRLAAENNIVIKQLTLGDEVESPDAVSLPLSLAIALLQDANGVIDLDLPLKGSLDDPEFSIWGTLGEVLLNLITKVVTSPFTALASLIDGEEELDQIAFAPGQSEIAEQGKETLGKVAEALAQRPALKIEVEGVANELDAEEFFRKAILAARATPAKGQPPIENQRAGLQPSSTLTDEEYRRHLLQAYYKQIAGMKYLAPDAPMISQNLNSKEVLESARRKVYSTMLADDAALRDLASERARNIREDLIAQGLDEERIFMLDVDLKPDEESETTTDDTLVFSKLSLNTD
ncbi:MAG: DUF748 domain-containing protein [Gammaproteobacteria bacterium]